MSKTYIFAGIGTLLVLVVGIVVFFTQSNQGRGGTISTVTSTSSLTAGTTQTTQQTGTTTLEASAPGRYIPYSAAALERDRINIIFFAASWCPSCRALDADIQANLSQIPANLVILKADYDAEVQLKQKYGVTIQHTLVRVDAQGNLIEKWNGLYNLSSLMDVVEVSQS